MGGREGKERGEERRGEGRAGQGRRGGRRGKERGREGRGGEEMCDCERSELSCLFNGPDFHYIFQADRRSINVLNVSTCI